METQTQKKRIIKITINKKQSKQLLIIVLLMIAVIIIVLATPYIIKNIFNKFVYIKLDFYKTQLGDIKFYSTKIPVANQKMEVTSVYNMNFRNDPRKLEYIEHNIPDNKIKFKKDKTVYISFNPDMEICEDNGISLINFAGFLRNFGQLNISSAVTYYDYAKQNELSYVTCENSKNNTVILLDSGNKTEIKQLSSNCYQIVYNNCEILQVTEKFMLIIIEDYMSFFERD